MPNPLKTIVVSEKKIWNNLEKREIIGKVVKKALD